MAQPPLVALHRSCCDTARRQPAGRLRREGLARGTAARRPPAPHEAWTAKARLWLLKVGSSKGLERPAALGPAPGLAYLGFRVHQNLQILQDSVMVPPSNPRVRAHRKGEGYTMGATADAEGAHLKRGENLS